MTRRDAIFGADPHLVRDSIERGDPLPGTAGFAGALDTTVTDTDDRERPIAGSGGTVVRDVLGRQPLFVDGERWSVDPDELSDPTAVGAGVVRSLTTSEPTHVFELPNPAPESDHDAAVAAVRDAVHESVRSVRAEGVAVAFSGGVDSALVAAGTDAPCYVVGFPGSHDVEAAREAAAAMDRGLHVIELDHADLERAVPEVVRATGRTNPMDVQIALPLYLVGERAAADGFDALAVGQGADELFGGYAKVVSPAEDHRVDADTVRGARCETVETLSHQLERDVLTLRAAGVEPVAPLLHDRVVAAALPLPGDLLATPDERKVALRRAARDIVPDSVRTADKKAVQYGSLVSRELDRLARQAGYKRRMDDHVGQYIRSLVADADATQPG